MEDFWTRRRQGSLSLSILSHFFFIFKKVSPPVCPCHSRLSVRPRHTHNSARSSCAVVGTGFLIFRFGAAGAAATLHRTSTTVKIPSTFFLFGEEDPSICVFLLPPELLHTHLKKDLSILFDWLIFLKSAQHVPHAGKVLNILGYCFIL